MHQKCVYLLHYRMVIVPHFGLCVIKVANGALLIGTGVDSVHIVSQW